MGARFSEPVQTVPEAHPASYTMDTGSFPEVKQPGRGVDHPPLSSVEVKERVELYLYSPSGTFSAFSSVNFTFTFTHTSIQPAAEGVTPKQGGRSVKLTINLQTFTTPHAFIPRGLITVPLHFYLTPTSSPPCDSFQPLIVISISLLSFFLLILSLL